jgi:hypothetical protein
MDASMKEKIDKAVAHVMPEAKELVERLTSDPMKTTKDNYGRLMSFLSRLGENDKLLQWLMLEAVTRCGYPLQTACQVARILGMRPPVAAEGSVF